MKRSQVIAARVLKKLLEHDNEQVPADIARVAALPDDSPEIVDEDSAERDSARTQPAPVEASASELAIIDTLASERSALEQMRESLAQITFQATSLFSLSPDSDSPSGRGAGTQRVYRDFSERNQRDADLLHPRGERDDTSQRGRFDGSLTATGRPARRAQRDTTRTTVAQVMSLDEQFPQDIEDQEARGD